MTRLRSSPADTTTNKPKKADSWPCYSRPPLPSPPASPMALCRAISASVAASLWKWPILALQSERWGITPSLRPNSKTSRRQSNSPASAGQKTKLDPRMSKNGVKNQKGLPSFLKSPSYCLVSPFILWRGKRNLKVVVRIIFLLLILLDSICPHAVARKPK